jgi:AcrR family transcriptional regulator
MPRPSRNLDRALLAAGRELLPARGCAGLTIREVCEAAGVNPGMFHYHFRTREAFLRAVLQQTYESMFAQFTLAATREWGPIENLRASLGLLGRFLRDNRAFIARVLSDALCGEPVAAEFLRDNMPRHLQVLHGLVAAGQEMGALRRMAPAQALGLCAGALAAPILFAAAVEREGRGRTPVRRIAASVVTDAAIDERIELALAALTVQPAPARSSGRKPR